MKRSALHGAIALLPLWALPALAQPPPPAAGRPSWLAEASLAVQETRDDNVLFQGLGPLANRDSYVTSITAAARVRLPFFSPRSKLMLGYAPEIVRYGEESDQDHENHVFQLGAGGRVGAESWELKSELTFTNGSDLARDWSSPLGFPRSPVIGGPEYRQRTENLEYKGAAMWRHALGPRWFVRPRLQWWGADFRTEQRVNDIPDPDNTFYGNYVDRSDVHGGVDVGRSIAPGVFLTLGYRVGTQDQGPLAGSPFQYDNDYQVVLFGIEGAAGERIRYSLQAGPDFRSYGTRVRDGEDRTPVEVYADGKAQVGLSAKTDLSLMLKLFKFMPGGGAGAMHMRLGNLELRHAASERVDLKAGFRVYGGSLRKPDPRGTDWLFTGYGGIGWSAAAHVRLGVDYLVDAGRSEADDFYATPGGLVPGPNGSGREYDRHLVSASVQVSL